MIKTVNIYIKSCPFPERVEPLQHFVEGMYNIDPNLSFKVVENFTYQYADLSILYGIPKPFEKEGKLSRARTNIYAGAKFTETPILIFDMPIFGRTIGAVNARINSYRILEGHALNYGRYPIGNENRWSKIAKRNNIKIKGQRKGIIGIAAQKEVNTNMFGLDQLSWMDSVIEILRKETQEPIGIKSHTLDRKSGVDIFNPLLTKYNNISIIDDINICKSLITYTGGISVEALINGTAVISCHRANWLHGLVSNNVLDAINPSLDNRLDVLKKLAYIQWDIAEMRSGKAWKYIRTIL